MARLQRAESNDEARLSQRERLSQASLASVESTSSAEIVAPPPGVSGRHSEANSISSAEWVPAPPILKPTDGEAAAAAAEAAEVAALMPPSPDTPPPVATRFPDDVSTPKRDDYTNSFRGLSASLAGRPY